MLHRMAADLIVVLHLIFILFVVLGGFLVLRRPWMSLVHLPSAAWGALIEFTGWICPLTPLENRFRRLAGDQGYSGGFIDHYITPLIYPDSLSRDTQILLGFFVILVNAVLYGGILLRHSKGRK
ncbi:MAG: DUF2784 domain-containing protein [Deltaproteobacteria bacterium]|nr:DUF2784 domain-containing protein [Deltaproteobacteria bacterium]